MSNRWHWMHRRKCTIWRQNPQLKGRDLIRWRLWVNATSQSIKKYFHFFKSYPTRMKTGCSARPIIGDRICIGLTFGVWVEDSWERRTERWQMGPSSVFLVTKLITSASSVRRVDDDDDVMCCWRGGESVLIDSRASFNFRLFLPAAVLKTQV